MPATLCQLCQKRPASTHLTELLPHGGWTLVHTCAICLNSRDLDPHQQPISLSKLMLETPAEAVQQAGDEAENPRCAQCGLDWEAYQAHSRFGCPACPDAFGTHVIEALRSYHGADSHTGRRPGCPPQDDPQRHQWELALAAALAAEDYREAARLRDLLRGRP